MECVLVQYTAFHCDVINVVRYGSTRSGGMVCNVFWCDAMQCISVQCVLVQLNAFRCNAGHFGASQHNFFQCGVF